MHSPNQPLNRFMPQRLWVFEKETKPLLPAMGK